MSRNDPGTGPVHGVYDMRFGCFASLWLWLLLASILSGSLVPVAIGVVMYAFLIAFRGLRSDWPLY